MQLYRRQATSWVDCPAVPRRIVLFGASGYTGRLVAEALVHANVRPALAYEYVAGNLAAALVLGSLESPASRVEVGYFFRGPHRRAISVGTRVSAGAAAFSPSHAWRGGALQTVTAGDRVRVFQIDGR